MFTVCPKCALTLAVTAADLRVAQGYVRCGRCSSVFNAIARLTEERLAGAAPEALIPPAPAESPPAAAAAAESAAAQPAPAATPAAAPPPPPPPEGPPQPAETSAEEALEFNPATTDVNSVFVQPPPDPQWTAATGSFRALVAANQDSPAEELLPDSQVDVEIDSAFLASMLRAEGSAAKKSEAAPEAPPRRSCAGARHRTAAGSAAPPERARTGEARPPWRAACPPGGSGGAGAGESRHARRAGALRGRGRAHARTAGAARRGG